MENGPRKSARSRGDETLYERVGGEEGVRRLVDDFYDRVLGDPELRPVFEGANIDRLHRMQRVFFAAALGGPVEYVGRPLSEAHFGHKIERPQFARFVGHLLATLERFDLEDRDVKAIIARVNTYADEILGRGHGAGG